MELSILKRLRHENIITIYGNCQESLRFLVLEKLNGGTLEKLIFRQHKPSLFGWKACSYTLPVLDAIILANEIARAMKYLHEEFNETAMIIHRGTVTLDSRSISYGQHLPSYGIC